MPATVSRVGIGLCADLELENGLDLGALRRELQERLPHVGVEIAAGLCHGPERTPDIVDRAAADRVVFGLCARPSTRHEFQAWTRKAGLDPLALELVDLYGVASVNDATRVLAAAVARLRAFTGSRPAQLKLELLPLEQKRSRRSLFSLPPSTYRAVASVEDEKCLGVQRCGLCISTCPFEAIGGRGAGVKVDRGLCASCGVCVTVCPTDAIGLPGSNLCQYEAEIAALLAAERPRLLFACRRAADLRSASDGRGHPPAGWLPVEVPCLGMVTPGWVLQALAGGASSVALVSCGESCHSEKGSAVVERVNYARELLRLLGETSPSERVMLVAGSEPLPAGPDMPRSPEQGRRARGTHGLRLLEPAATTEAVLDLAERSGASAELSLMHSGSPVGFISLREETCTACGACPAVCPTQALLLEQEEEETIVSFDAGLCVACGRCVPVCPEGEFDTLSVDRGTDLGALTRGRAVLKRATMAPCRRCGRPIAPDAMMDRIRVLLGGEEESEELVRVLTGLCSDCRGVGPDTSHD